MTVSDAQVADVILDVRHLSKTFGATRALNDVDIAVASGEIVALCGQNGSGKSTLVKVLAGFHEPDGGASITVHGQPYEPGRAHGKTLHFIHQDLALVDSLSTVENLALSRPATSALLLPNRDRRETDAATAALSRLGVSFDVHLPVGQLSQAERTMVAIARAIDGWDRADNILVLDEPTASLHQTEAELLFAAVRNLAHQGAGVLFISHRLDEVMQLADRAVIFRDGRMVASLAKTELSPAAIVSAMVGATVHAVDVTPFLGGRTVLDVQNVVGDRVDGLSLRVAAGEILGISGLIGSGAETLGSIVSGGRPRRAGKVTVDGVRLPSGDISASIRRGLAWAPAERQTKGVIMTESVSENLVLPLLRPITNVLGSIRGRLERRDAEHWLARLGVRPADPDAAINQLSGGNQQKVVIAKWLRTSPRVLWLDEPTQGVDVAAKAAIHALIAEVAKDGTAVVVSSTDTSELVGIAHRVLVLDAGRIVGELRGEEISEERLLTASLHETTLTTR